MVGVKWMRYLVTDKIKYILTFIFSRFGFKIIHIAFIFINFLTIYCYYYETKIGTDPRTSKMV